MSLVVSITVAQSDLVKKQKEKVGFQCSEKREFKQFNQFFKLLGTFCKGPLIIPEL